MAAVSKTVASKTADGPMSARSSAVSTVSLKSCKRLSRLRVVQTVPLRRRISIARVSLPTTSTRCVARWTNVPRAAMVNSKEINRANNRDNNKVASKVSNRANSRDNSKVKKGSRDSQDSRARKAVNRKEKQAAARTAVNRRPEETAAALIEQDRWAATGPRTGNCLPRSANGCVRRRICDVSGAQAVWARDGLTKS